MDLPWLLLVLFQCHTLLSQNVTDSDTQYEKDSDAGNSTVTHEAVNKSNETDTSHPNITTQTTSSDLDQAENMTSDNTESAEQNKAEGDVTNTTVQGTDKPLVDKDVTTQAFNDTEEVKRQNGTTKQNTTATVPVERTDFLTPTGSHFLDTAWMKTFLSIRHFDGWYTYDSGNFLFDFVARFVHPTNSSVLVATFYDEDGAILDMHGTSADGRVVTFTSSKMYSESFRFSTDIVLQFNGSFVNKGDSSVYSGAITLPQNSSFQRFHMQKGVEKPVSVDEQTSKTAVIIAVVACISFIFILGTGSLICWAMRKGYLQKSYKSYRPFRDSLVTYESDAETVHI